MTASEGALKSAFGLKIQRDSGFHAPFSTLKFSVKIKEGSSSFKDIWACARSFLQHVAVFHRYKPTSYYSIFVSQSLKKNHQQDIR